MNLFFLASAGGSGLGGGRLFPDFFDQVIGYLEALWKWFIGLIHSISYVIDLCFDSLAVVGAIVGVVPSVIGSCVIIVTVIAIVKLIFGR